MADTQRVIIEFVGDTTALEPAIAELQKLGQIDKASADVFTKTNQQLADRTRAINQAAAAQKGLTTGAKETAVTYDQLSKNLGAISTNILKGASSDTLKQFILGIKDGLAEAGITADQLADKLTNELAPAVDKPEQKFKSLKSELRQLKQDIASGALKGDALLVATQRAGELEDRIGDVNRQVRVLASDTRGIDTLIEATNGLAAGFQIVQGASALVGDQNEDLQKTLVRLTAVMSIANGLQQVGNLLQKESAILTGITVAQQRLLVVQKQLEGAVESKNIFIRNAAIVAQRALNAAMAANPAGLLVAAFVAVGAAIFAFSKEEQTATDKAKELNEALQQQLEITQQLDTIFRKSGEDKVESLEKELALAQARGASALEINDIERRIASQKAVNAKESAGFNADILEQQGLLEASYEKQIEQLLALSKLVLDPSQSDEEKQNIRDRIELLKLEIATTKGRLDVANKIRQEINQTQTELEEVGIRRIKIEADNAKKLAEEAEKARKKAKEVKLGELDDNKALLEAQLAIVKEGSEAETNLRLAILQVQAQIDLLSLDGTRNNEAQRLKIINEAEKAAGKIRTDAAAETRNKLFEQQAQFNSIDANRNATSLAQAEQGTQAELQLKKDAIEILADQRKLDAQRTITDKKLLQSELDKIDAEALAAKKAADKEYFDTKTQQAKDAAQAEIDAQQMVVDFTISSITDMANFAFNQESQALNQRLNAQLSALDAQREAELNNESLTQAQRDKINKKYVDQEKKLRNEIAKKQRDADTQQAIVNGLLGITKVLATTPTGDFGIARALLIAQTILTTALQVAAIRSAPLPQFRAGGLAIHGPGTGTSDSILARISAGESVITARETKDYMPALRAIHTRAIDPAIMNAFAGFRLRDTGRDLINESMRSLDIDYKKLGKSVSDELGENFEELIQVGRATKKSLDTLPDRMPGGSQPYRSRRRI